MLSKLDNLAELKKNANGNSRLTVTFVVVTVQNLKVMFQSGHIKASGCLKQVVTWAGFTV